MPIAAPRPCTAPGCGKLVKDGSGRCEKHKGIEKKALDAKRGGSTARGYDSKWQRARETFLRENPLCKRHADRDELVEAIVVDHIVPHKGDMSLFWRRSNWQSLCKPCHDSKTAMEDGGFGRRNC